MKRLVSVFLVLCMMLSCVAVGETLDGAPVSYTHLQMANLGHGCLAGFTTADTMQPLALRCAQGLAANRFFDDGYALSLIHI